MLELGDDLLLEVVVDDGHLKRGGHVGKEVAIVRALQVQFQVWKERNNILIAFSNTIDIARSPSRVSHCTKLR